jgi:hypothetical protein
MISHVFVGVNDFEHAFRFYSALMQVLGHGLRFNEPAKPWAGWMPPDAPSEAPPRAPYSFEV